MELAVLAVCTGADRFPGRDAALGVPLMRRWIHSSRSMIEMSCMAGSGVVGGPVVALWNWSRTQLRVCGSRSTGGPRRRSTRIR